MKSSVEWIRSRLVSRGLPTQSGRRFGPELALAGASKASKASLRGSWVQSLSVAVLAVIVAAPYVGAGNGTGDADSPYNMPSLSDGGSNGSGNGSGGSGGSGGGGSAKSAGGESNGHSSGSLSPLVLAADPAATIEVTSNLHSGAYAVIDGVKLATVAGSAGPRATASVEIRALAGSNVVVVDSDPLHGDTSAEASGAFEVRGATNLTMVTGAPYDQSTDLLMIGPTDPKTGGLAAVEAVIPLTGVGPSLNVAALDAALASQPAMVGKTAVLALGQTESAIGGDTHVKFSSLVQFKIAAQTNYRIDTSPHLP